MDFSLAALFKEFFQFLTNIFITPKRQIRKINRIYDAMKRIITGAAIQRVLIVKIHNGGGLIKPNAELYASVLYEDYISPFKSVKKQYQRLPVDKEYIKMLMDIIEKKKIYYAQDEVPSEMVKGLYVQSGVLNAVIYFLGQDKRNIYVCSCASGERNENLETPNQYVPIDLEINVIRQNIK